MSMHWMKIGLASMLLVGVTVAYADSEKDHDRARQLRGAGVIVPVEPLVADAKRRLPGRLLEIELEDDEDGNLVYEIELVDGKGVVREFFFDARTGRFLKEDVDWNSKSDEHEGRHR